MNKNLCLEELENDLKPIFVLQMTKNFDIIKEFLNKNLVEKIDLTKE